MINFPIIEAVEIDGYRLYPGSGDDGLHARFSAGPWVILGVNGLGKTTLLLLLRHLLTGPARVRNPGFTGEHESDLLPSDTRMFAVRVSDQARTAVGSITARFGKSRLVIRRRLRDLAIIEFHISDGVGKRNGDDELTLREELSVAMGVADFANVVRILDRLVFYLESREGLIWNSAAQYEVFRALLLPSETATDLRRLEGKIVSADSAARNLSAVLYKIRSNRNKELHRRATAADVRAELARATADLDRAKEQEHELLVQLEKSEVRRLDARTALWRAEKAVDEAARRYELSKFEALRHALIKVSPTDQYVLLRLITENACLACGSKAEAAAAELRHRQSSNRCIVCGTPRKQNKKVLQTATALQARAEKDYLVLESARHAFGLAQEEFDEAINSHLEFSEQLKASRDVVDQYVVETRSLRKRLPKEDQDAISRDETQIETLEATMQNFLSEREAAENQIGDFIGQTRNAVESMRASLEDQFRKRAKDFFAEQIRLVYAPRHERIGQQGRRFEFPAFEIEMTAGALDERFARRSVDQVSLSQREYLDILFRIAIMETIGSTGCTLVVDGPESSLDAVFAERGGRMFSDFATISGRKRNVLIAACNVIEGSFIPQLLSEFTTKTARRERAVNLLNLAAPTAALKELQAEYGAAVEKILSQKARK